jgi:hypothetical protein
MENTHNWELPLGESESQITTQVTLPRRRVFAIMTRKMLKCTACQNPKDTYLQADSQPIRSDLPDYLNAHGSQPTSQPIQPIMQQQTTLRSPRYAAINHR